MIVLYLIGAVLILLAVIAALIYRNRAQQQQHRAETQSIIADGAIAQTKRQQKQDAAMSRLHEEQRNEIVQENMHLADRDDFTTDWGVRDSGTDGIAASCGSFASEPSSAADHSS